MSERSLNPVLLRVTRSGFSESHHRGAIAVFSGKDGRAFGLGNICDPTLMRSTAKPAQTLAILEGPAEARFHFSDDELAIMSASHSGERRQVLLVRSILQKAGLNSKSLKCGTHPRGTWIGGHGAKRNVLYNNCSGKHAGMLAQCVALGAPRAGYEHPGHPVQRRILRVASALAGVPLPEIQLAFDNCTAPTFRLPLWRIALMYSRLVGTSDSKDHCTERLFRALASRPHLLSGKTHPVARISRALGPGILIKEGGEGVCAASAKASSRFPAGVGIAVKIDDGSERAVLPVLIEVFRQLGIIRRRDLMKIREWHSPILLDFRGRPVGRLEPHFDLVKT